MNKWSKLGIGRVRYGVMCAEDGVIMDHGATGRLDSDDHLMNMTSSGAEAVAEWAENWRQTVHRDWQVHLTPVTMAYASMNVAGPRSGNCRAASLMAWTCPAGVRLHARAHGPGGGR